MIIRVRHTDENGESLGYSYHSSVSKAEQYIKDYGGEICDTSPTPHNKTEILSLLRFWGGHADNG